jgi:hypothetical protein
MSSFLSTGIMRTRFRLCLLSPNGESKSAGSGWKPWKCLSASRHAGQMPFCTAVSNHEELVEKVRMILGNREGIGPSQAVEGLPKSA